MNRTHLAAAVVLAGMTACARGDVGAPCHHGHIDPPSSPVVTYPARQCNSLFCVYNEDVPPAAEPCTPGDDDACNEPGESIYECATTKDGTGTCRVSTRFVLRNSMCSKKCVSDADCQDTLGRDGLAEKTACENGFKCAVVQSLGDFCCEKLCICADELGADFEDAQQACEEGTLEGCCQPSAGQDPDSFVRGAGCG